MKASVVRLVLAAKGSEFGQTIEGPQPSDKRLRQMLHVAHHPHHSFLESDAFHMVRHAIKVAIIVVTSATVVLFIAEGLPTVMDWLASAAALM